MLNYISRLIDDPDPLMIIPYGGYANANEIYATARVLEDEGIEHSEEDGFVKNVFNSFKRFETDEIPNAKVNVTINNKVYEYNSDKEGYVHVNQQAPIFENDEEHTKWLFIKYELMINNKAVFTTESQIMQPSPKAQYGVITDMDDTVIDTGISSTLKYKVIVNTFFKHSSRRMPLEGAKDFYEMLHKGVDGNFHNPFFYLSNSPWNLFTYLNDFLNHHNFPKGTLLLRDIGFENPKKESFLERNKFLKISHILNTYPNMQFVLIGDAADIDYDIYIEIARQFPNRIAAIYIRSVHNKKKMKMVKNIIETTTDVAVVLIENTDEAVSHAAKNGLINV